MLQVIAGTRTFDARQRLACDVTGNGTLSSLDAANILQRQVGLLTRFAAATRCDSDWLFDPVATPAPAAGSITPLLTAASCQRGAIAYEPLAGDQTPTRTSVGILFGDCTGNWQPPGARRPGGAGAERRAGRAAARLAAHRRRDDARADRRRCARSVLGGRSHHRARAPVCAPVAVRPLRGAANALMISNLNDPGRARIALASGEPLQPGAILVLDIEADENAAPDVRLLRALVDDEPAIATTGASRLAQ